MVGKICHKKQLKVSHIQAGTPLEADYFLRATGKEE